MEPDDRVVQVMKILLYFAMPLILTLGFCLVSGLDKEVTREVLALMGIWVIAFRLAML